MKNLVFVSASLLVTLVACDRESMEPTATPLQQRTLADVGVTVAGFTTLSTNLDHTCILDPAGHAFCAGYGGRGAIGYGGQTGFIVEPFPVTGGHSFTSVSTGSLHTCALTTAGQAYCWGSNAMGELGAITPPQCEYGSTPCAFAPVPVMGGLTFAQIDAGNQFTCALDPSGRAYCWGDNRFGQLGDGTKVGRTSPTPVGGGLTFVSLGTGGFHTCGLTATGDLYCWGFNAQGQLGAPSSNQCTYFQTYPCSTSPIHVGAGLRFMAVDPGTVHTCALDRSGKGYCWGSNSHGQLGDGGLANQPFPTPVASTLTFTRIASGTESSCTIDASANGYCWGQSFGRAPALIGGGFKWQVLLPHDDHRCGLALDGSPYCWGLEQYGELGNGGHHQEQFVTPQLMAPPHVIDQPPVAKIIVTGCVNLGCTFNGGYSTDDFGIVRWSWDFGDGTTGAGSIANHTFPQSGTYTVKLTVFDASQQSSSTSTGVSVYYQPVNQLPVAAFTASCIVRPDGVGADCQADGTASSDPDGTISAYTWTATGRAAKSGPIVSYAYPVGTTQTITLTVVDNLGGSNSKSTTFTVGTSTPPPPPPPTNLPPVANFTYQCVARSDGIGSDCTFNGASSGDTDGIIAAYLWQVPGRINKTTVTATYPLKRGTSASVTLTVTDDDGATASKSLTFTVP